jgi:hypothetical protein
MSVNFGVCEDAPGGTHAKADIMFYAMMMMITTTNTTTEFE